MRHLWSKVRLYSFLHRGAPMNVYEKFEKMERAGWQLKDEHCDKFPQCLLLPKEYAAPNKSALGRLPNEEFEEFVERGYNVHKVLTNEYL